MNTYIFGHIKPDLDSVVAAISFTEYRKQMGDIDVIPAMSGAANPETAFVFNKFQQSLPQQITAAEILPDDRVILVDHNETDQRIDNLGQEQIVSIYDHHTVYLNLTHPIEIIVLPLGSSNTIAWKLFKQNNLTIPQNIATLMLCAILSDTVGLKSSTTTETDKLAVADLSAVSNIADINSLTLDIFKAKSNVSALSDEQVILNDYKIFDFGKKVFIGQLETVEQDTLLSGRKAGLLAALQAIKEREGVDYIILAITDILKVNTKLLVDGAGETDLIQKAFGGTVQENILDIGAKMSRKKDIAPAIEKALIQ
ncbi:MAG: Inorganic diphosphatase [Microgenomates group bacterium GW2011_GWC1_44_37]|uniref:inorganic diphosphatase n=1 Tax=Candidatus Collierbacteria bacterium GW2011_GWB2_44_22 TaxID=1618387 RepID=A0A0G1HYI3_9BACT|nr:MAG: Inorganic diphosphatase [Candidatus Collierbacteria bacterium GW2011_GWA2_44_13]KKT51527.1 MAG: Inorganic diphosphatase [Candidatus Collierbacteria bacterium GW2011_GWB1_44_197]KKT52020.1 MAG: Inorganic diphosphatase [Candidatus Collierbacteria bacterium GW2011_GWB2_44_22]KKT62122.1 MAG: Inorganic diphosphatase [Candidatus Collierbacteria bacterium GW2011_GWD1_44_27]KKT66692.1 MAG: Inorganic diphosphatase [Candidatus Collierbacteria bacterium GW2011_GWC2_44_30]KKT69383.1 MAG: Inorganic